MLKRMKRMSLWLTVSLLIGVCAFGGNVFAYNVVNQYSVFTGYTDEEVAKFGDYTIVDKYEEGNNLYIIYKNNTNLKIVDWKGNEVIDKLINQSGFTYIGVANGNIVYRISDSFYKYSISTKSSALIVTNSNYIGFSTDGLLAFGTYTKENDSSVDLLFYRYSVEGYDVINNVKLYAMSNNIATSMQRNSTNYSYMNLTFSVKGWNVFVYATRMAGNYSGYCLVNKNGVETQRCASSEGGGYQNNSYVVPCATGLIYWQRVQTSNNYNVTFYNQAGTQNTGSWNLYNAGSLSGQYWWGYLSSVSGVIKTKGTNVGKMYTQTALSSFDIVKILYEDDEYLLVTAHSSSNGVGNLALFKAGTGNALELKWSIPVNYPDYSAVIDKQNNIAYVYSKSTTDVNASNIWKLNFETGARLEAGLSGMFSTSQLYPMYYVKDKQLFLKNGDSVYRRTLTGTNSSSKPQIITTVKDISFTCIIGGEFSTDTPVNGVSAVPSVGNGYTTLSGRITVPGVQPMEIGGRRFIFNVLEPPVVGSIAAVTFE